MREHSSSMAVRRWMLLLELWRIAVRRGTLPISATDFFPHLSGRTDLRRICKTAALVSLSFAAARSWQTWHPLHMSIPPGRRVAKRELWMVTVVSGTWILSPASKCVIIHPLPGVLVLISCCAGIFHDIQSVCVRARVCVTMNKVPDEWQARQACVCVCVCGARVCMCVCVPAYVRVRCIFRLRDVFWVFVCLLDWEVLLENHLPPGVRSLHPPPSFLRWGQEVCSYNLHFQVRNCHQFQLCLWWTLTAARRNLTLIQIPQVVTIGVMKMQERHNPSTNWVCWISVVSSKSFFSRVTRAAKRTLQMKKILKVMSCPRINHHRPTLGSCRPPSHPLPAAHPTCPPLPPPPRVWLDTTAEMVTAEEAIKQHTCNASVSHIMSLVRFADGPVWKVVGCGKPRMFFEKVIGCTLVCRWKSTSGHKVGRWASSSRSHDMYANNLIFGLDSVEREQLQQNRSLGKVCYFKSRIFRTHSIFVSWALQPFVCILFSYSRWALQILWLASYFSHAFYFRTEATGYEIYENNMHTKYSWFTIIRTWSSTWPSEGMLRPPSTCTGSHTARLWLTCLARKKS